MRPCCRSLKPKLTFLEQTGSCAVAAPVQMTAETRAFLRETPAARLGHPGLRPFHSASQPVRGAVGKMLPVHRAHAPAPCCYLTLPKPCRVPCQAAVVTTAATVSGSGGASLPQVPLTAPQIQGCASLAVGSPCPSVCERRPPGKTRRWHGFRHPAGRASPWAAATLLPGSDSEVCPAPKVKH